WEKILKESRYGRLVDGVIVDNGIAILGEYDTLSQKSNVFINIIDYNKQIVFEKELMGSLNEYANNIYFYKNTLVFCGVSESKDKDFMRYSDDGYDIFIGKIHLLTNEFELQMTGNRKNDSLISSSFLNGKLYLYAYFRGEGFYY